MLFITMPPDKNADTVWFPLEISETIKPHCSIYLLLGIKRLFFTGGYISYHPICSVTAFNLPLHNCLCIQQYTKHIETGQGRQEEKRKRQTEVIYDRDEKRAVIRLQFSGSVFTSILPQSMTVLYEHFCWLQWLQSKIIFTVTTNVKTESWHRARLLV